MKILCHLLGGGYKFLRFCDRTTTNLSKPRKSIVNWHLLKKRKSIRLLKKTDKLHLGCANIRIENYINIDAVRLPEVDFQCNLKRLYDFFPENSISEIYICHALEHLPARFISLYLKQFYYILKVNGILRISVPDIAKIMTVAKTKDWSDDEIELLQGVTGGGQDHKYNYHKSFFWPEYLKRKLEQANFRNIEEYPLRPHFTNQDIFDASNCAGFKPYGMGLSLNMKAEK
ncbi:MAG: hypothetical protein P9M03_00500 [Candidatus Theseobacter exili]|nr:hypothetical protein [Candidatus Theseobacter exili]